MTPCLLPKHEADHGQPHEGCGDADVALIVAYQPAVVADPSQRPFGDPALGQDDEVVLVAAAHDLQRPWPGSVHRRQHFRPLVSGIADHPLGKWKLAAGPDQQRLGPVAVLDAGRVDERTQQQPKRVGQDVAFTANGPLARIVTRGVERRPPF